MSNASQSQSFDGQVYTGFWINQAKGSPYGATWTLSRQTGSFLIAFLALFVSITGQSFWTISRFLLHRHLSSESQSDGVYHQHQAILRNSRTAPHAAQETLRLMVAWRNRTRRLFFRLLPIWMVACSISAGFAVAGIFSSQVTANQSNEVLLHGTGCGTSLTQDMYEVSTKSARYRSKKYLDYLNYALACYQGEQTTQSSCQLYTKPKLSYEIDRNATCPFDEKLCQSASDNLKLDSGYLDSWEDLGMNAEPRFKIRLKQHCAPLVTRGYTQSYVDPTDTSKRYLRYSYLRNDTTTNTTRDVTDYGVYMVPLKDQFETLSHVAADSSPLDYRPRYIPIARGEEPHFVPELNRTDAISSLLFLDSTDMVYLEKVEDLWFSATTNAPEWRRELYGTDSLYISDEPAAVIGCTSQVFYCNPKIENIERGCANLYTFESQLDSIAPIWPEPNDLKAFIGYLATNNVLLATPGSFYSYQGLPNMLARLTTEGSRQLETLPRDQWKKEMEFISQGSLASLQSNVPQASQNGLWFLNRTLCDGDTEAGLCEKLCRSQKVRSSEYYSFNVLGVAIIISVGLFLMVLAGFIETITSGIDIIFSHEKPHTPPYGRLEWDSNSYLDLQRLAHQALGIGTWSRSRTGVPITAPGEKLGVISSTPTSALPVLKRPRPTGELQDVVDASSYQGDDSTDYAVDTGYSYSTHSPVIDQPSKAQDHDTSLQDPDTKTNLPSRYLRRSVYARVRTDELSTTHEG